MMEHVNVEDDEDWVVVKKQRIIFLIPTLPIHHQTENAEAFHTNTKPKRSDRRLFTRKKKSLSEERHYKAATFLGNTIATKDNIKKPVERPSDESYIVDSRGVGGPTPVNLVSPSKDGSKNHKQITTEKSVKQITTEKSVGNPCGISYVINIGVVDCPRPVDLVSSFIDGTKNHKQVNVCRKLLLQHAPVSHIFSQKEIVVDSKKQAVSSSGSINLQNATSNVVNRKIRALNFQRRLQIFGGLRSWLLSLGLSQLMQILEREKLGIYQLVDLTMSKLKGMGVIAVGPRRKLINSIDSFCRPYYLKALK